MMMSNYNKHFKRKCKFFNCPTYVNNPERYCEEHIEVGKKDKKEYIRNYMVKWRKKVITI